VAGPFYEDWEEGEEIETPGRTVSEADVFLFAGLTGDYNRLHTDEEFARSKSVFGKRVVHGLLGLSLGMGLFQRLGYMVNLHKGAYLGLRADFTAPIFLGDTITARVKVLSKRETKRADRGIVVFALSIVNQRGEEVCKGEHTLLIERRENTS
jgi:acyl dehydratase